MKRIIDHATDQVIEYLTAKSYGRPPANLDDVLYLAGLHGLDCDPRCDDPQFQADIVEWSRGQWSIRYNDGHAPADQARYILHELVEYLLRADLGAPWEPIRAEGVLDSFHLLHRIAESVTRTLLPEAPRMPPRLLALDSRYTRPREEIRYIPIEALASSEGRIFGRCAGD